MKMRERRRRAIARYAERRIVPIENRPMTARMVAESFDAFWLEAERRRDQVVYDCIRKVGR